MADVCHWPTGTAWTGPRTCGRPAKRQVSDHPYVGYAGIVGQVMPVCGIHANSARRRSDMTIVEDDR